jgi:proteasome lid subunit RPN8/RPN11
MENYAALITLTLPGMAGPASATIVLRPQDDVATADGRTIPLADCTLADLQAFADLLEEQVWQDYQSIRLADAAAEITLLGETETPLAEWQGYYLVMPEDGAGQTIDDRPQTVDDGSTMVEGNGELPKLEAQETTPEPEKEKPSSIVHRPSSDSDEVPVNVAESEPIRPEPEATPDQEPAPLPPDIRVAGKRRPVGHPTWTAVDILINESAFRAAQAHALSSPNREVAGVLIGPRPEKQPDGRYLVHITDTIIAKHTVMHGASVTYTPESWRYLNDKLAEMYPDETAVMVGWYHTHPGFGIFLSGMDQFIHQNFFTQIWHVALVLDPVARRSGFFCWDRPKQDVRAYEFPWPLWAAGTW